MGVCKFSLTKREASSWAAAEGPGKSHASKGCKTTLYGQASLCYCSADHLYSCSVSATEPHHDSVSMYRPLLTTNSLDVFLVAESQNNVLDACSKARLCLKSHSGLIRTAACFPTQLNLAINVKHMSIWKKAIRSNISFSGLPERVSGFLFIH